MISPLSALIFAVAVAISGTDQLIPTAVGTSWNYNMTEEAGEGFRFAGPKTDADSRLHAAVTYRINGTRKIDERELLEFEMHRDGRVTNTDLITVGEHGITCWARVDADGDLTKLANPQTIVAAPFSTGDTWEFDGEIGQDKVHQSYRVLGEEDVVVPAGKFRAFHIHGDQTTPGKMTIDRWFAGGVGIVKDVTETRSEDNSLLRRISLQLTERPKVSPRPNVKQPGSGKILTVTLAEEAIGESTKEFLSTTPKIYARWQGHALRQHAKVRAIWIAESVPDVAPPDYIIDEANTTATAPDSHGIFALARPGNGWIPGIYRVEFYVDGVFVDAIKVKVTKPVLPPFEPVFSPATTPP